MHKRFRKVKVMCLTSVAAALAVVGFASSASAHTGEFARFNYCPSTNATVTKCLYSVTTGGKVVLGKKTVPIVNPVTLQGGFTKPGEGGLASFVAATNGVTLAAVPQPVPGGLTGLVNCKEISNYFLRTSCEWTFENGITGVNSTLELAKPASEIRVSQANLANEEGTALRLPVKVHLENPFLGSECYVGSSSSPIIWNLTTGATSPPPPNTSIHGLVGETEFKEGGEIFHLQGNESVENAWSAPGASGCGGILFEWALNPIINSSVGVPSAAGKNTAILKNNIDIATAFSVNNH